MIQDMNLTTVSKFWVVIRDHIQNYLAYSRCLSAVGEKRINRFAC